MITHVPVDFCRCCGCERLFTYLDLGNQPLANSYHTGKGVKERFPLEVNVCQKCWHSQLSIAVNPKLMFDRYLYVSGTTQTFRNHCQEFAQEAMTMIGENPSVLDIACNDGTLLEAFRDLGAEVYGVDPAQNLREITEKKDIPVVVDYWGSSTTTLEVQELKKEFDIITAMNVFAHVDNADIFLYIAKSMLSENGVIILEFPYASKLFSDNEFDTVYHEHLSYFLVKSFKALTDRVGLTIVRASKQDIHGGSIRFYLKKEGSQAKIIRRLIEKEASKGLYALDTYIEFSKRILENKLYFKNSLKNISFKKVGYGASAKGNTMLNYFGVNLDFIVDDNDMKWGYYTPGTNIKIEPPQALDIDEPLVVVILSWNFYPEIEQKIKKIRGNKETYYMVYVPVTTIMK